MASETRNYLIQMGGSAVASAASDSLHDIRCYFEAMEAFLAAGSGERKLRLLAVRDSIDPKIRDHLIQLDSEPIWTDYFPSELRAAVLVSAMSFFERYINGVCAEVAILLRSSISHKRLAGTSIDRARVFLIELCKLSGPSGESWEGIKQLQRLRNSLVHNGGVPEDEKELKRFQNLTARMPGVSCSEFGIDLESAFVCFALDEVSRFLTEMAASLGEMCENVKAFEGKN